MVMGYFIYNGTSSQRFGILERNPIPPRAELTFDTITIPGRRETLMRENSLRNDIPMEHTLGMTSQDALRAAYKWLVPPGRLILSSRPNEVYDVKNIRITPETAGRRFLRLRIAFTCSPYAKRLGEQEIIISTPLASTPITNSGTLPAWPVITLTLDDPPPVLLGDVNKDGKVNATDAAMILQYAATIAGGGDPGWDQEQITAGDVNRDGAVNATDAALVLQIAAAQGAGHMPETVYDIYIHAGESLMRIVTPAICSEHKYPVTVDTEHQIVYYTLANGQKVNILHYTYGDLPVFPVGVSDFYCIGAVTQAKIRLNEVVA